MLKLPLLPFIILPVNVGSEKNRRIDGDAGSASKRHNITSKARCAETSYKNYLKIL